MARIDAAFIHSRVRDWTDGILSPSTGLVDRNLFGDREADVLAYRASGRAIRRCPSFSPAVEASDRNSLMISTSNQSMKPTPKAFASRLAPFRCNSSVFATTPWVSSRRPASLVRFAFSRSRTPAVMLFNASRGLSLSR
jgi:hypothetical protein